MLDAPAPLVPLLTREFPRQRAFSYPRNRWQRWTAHLDGVGAVLHGLPDEFDRHTSAQHVRDLVARDIAGAFTVAMIWGHGHSGYGGYRTARILTGSSTSARVSPVCPDVVHRLTRSIDIARTQGALEGYRYLNNRDGKVRGLGAAFFTERLYFVTADGDPHSPAAAPVLDALIIRLSAAFAGRARSIVLCCQGQACP